MVHSLSDSHRRKRKRSKKPSYSASCEALASNTKVQVREQVAHPCQSIESNSGPGLPDGFEGSLCQLLAKEMTYHPRTDYLFSDSICEDKVDAGLRDDAVFNLRFLHKFHSLAPECFAHAVNATDRFLARVKVKPKYMACLATAAYLMAAKMIEERENWPSPEKLVRIARCGGSPTDLGRMEAIIRAKLRPDSAAAAGGLEAAVTPLHFLALLRPLFRPGGDGRSSSYQRAVDHLETCLCSVDIYCYRPALLALCVARRYLTACEQTAMALDRVAALLGVSASELLQCDSAVEAEGLRARGSRRHGRRRGRQASASRTSWGLLGGCRPLSYRGQKLRRLRLHQLGPINEELWDETCLQDICQLFH